MASLKALKLRIGSVKSTQKITKAMKMVAAAKLRRAQSNAEAGRPYSTRLAEVVSSLASRVTIGPQSPKLIAGSGSDQRHLIVVATGETKAAMASAAVEYEPDEEEILAALLPKNIAIQVYRALLENAAGFYGSQMTAMDNATRNAGDMINRLSIAYNRQRQAAITTELVEIISGAEAL